MELADTITVWLVTENRAMPLIRFMVMIAICWILAMGLSGALSITFSMLRWSLRKWAKMPDYIRAFHQRRRYERYRLQREKDLTFHQMMMDTDVYQKKCRELIEKDHSRQDYRSRKAVIGNLVITTLKDEDESFISGLILAMSPWEVVIAPGSAYSIDFDPPGRLRGGFLGTLDVTRPVARPEGLTKDNYIGPLLLDWGQIAEVYTEDGERLVDRLDKFDEWPGFKKEIEGKDKVDSTSTAEATNG